MASAPSIELANLVLSRVPGLQFTRHGRGTVRYVVSDVRRGRHLSLQPAAYRLLGAFDGEHSIGQIYARQGATLPAPDAAARVIVALHAAGLVTGDALPVTAVPSVAAPLEAKLVSWRRELVELGPALPLLDRLLGWMFTRTGVALWAGLVVVGLWTLTDRPLGTRDALGWFAQLDAGEALSLYLIFLVLKGVHELGHAVAYRRFAAAEGVPVGSVRAGLALMFLVPFPFTNVTGAWQLAGKWRRTMVGAAGMYVESWAALAGLLVWAWISDPVLRAAAGQVAAVSGITTILFNLNPLGRMDGYYIFTDLVDRPNLARQASQAALAVLARLTGALPASRTGTIDAPLLLYWTGAFLFRVTIYAALFWAAVDRGAGVAIVVLLIAGSLLVGRPLAGSLRWLLSVADDRARTRRRLILVIAGLAAVLLVPLPATIPLDGIVERDGLTLVFPPRAARLSAAGPLQFATAEARLDAADVAAQQQAAIAQWRRAIDDGQPDAHVYGDSARALGEQAARAQRDVSTLATGLSGPALAPLDLDDRRGSVVPVGGRPIAVRLPTAAFTIRAVGRESDRAAIDRARHGSARALGAPTGFRVAVRAVAAASTDDLPSAALGRPAGGAIAVAPNDRSGRRAADPLVAVVLVPTGATPPLRHGQRVEVRLNGSWQPIIARIGAGLTLALGAGARE